MKKILAFILVIVMMGSVFTSCEEIVVEETVVEETVVEDIVVDYKSAYVRDGKKMIFGSYPQSEVTDVALKNTLNLKAGTLPTKENSQAWSFYDYMWYIDVEEGGEKYRGIYFTSYRPKSYAIENNGYYINTVYWFKYEPISWTILSENTTDGTALLWSDIVLDSQPLTKSVQETYAQSSIRKWLNEVFYNTAFEDFEKEIIITSTVDNSHLSFENTQDKVLLLSETEVSMSGYYDLEEVDELEEWAAVFFKNYTSYALSQGGYFEKEKEVGEVSVRMDVWPLKTHVYDVFSQEEAEKLYKEEVFLAPSGVVPAVKIKL